MNETFLLSNIAPQVGDGFNRHCTLEPVVSRPVLFDLSADWAYLEDWCRKLTNSFDDVYVFTVPLYLPRQDSDGKWRVVRMLLVFTSTMHVHTILDARSYREPAQRRCPHSLRQGRPDHEALAGDLHWGIRSAQRYHP